ncbi:MAG: RNA polymerase-binding protein DksA [Gammaproteobacteria bacterium]|nr:RNA polymerase-binding protein DksA [Gammaproteobacteria bacterium]
MHRPLMAFHLLFANFRKTLTADPVDRAAQEEEFAIELRTRDRERKLIKKIEKTLELIERNDFGYCESCGIEIGIRRLEARPTADLCIDCKSLAEIREKQMKGH